MDMGTSSMDMGTSSMAMATATAASAAPSATKMSMGGMGGMGGMGDSDPHACKISMLWNWYTVDSCFIARSWHVTSKGMFAGTCIGILLLVMSLEFLRRAGIEWDAYIIRKHSAALGIDENTCPAAGVGNSNGHGHSHDDGASSSSAAGANNKGATATTVPAPQPPTFKNIVYGSVGGGFRPTLFEHTVRSVLHMLQFFVAYMVMLLAMYYNGYVLITIFIGAGLGFFVFNWRNLGGGGNKTSAHAKEVTYCCG